MYQLGFSFHAVFVIGVPIARVGAISARKRSVMA